MEFSNEILNIDLQYFASVNWYKKVYQYKYINISEFDRHAKMCFRNRLWIAGADGRLSLTVPVEGSRNEKQLYKDVQIAPGNWAVSQFRTILSCYNNSPWFEHYRDELAVLYESRFKFLWDWNLACFNWMNRYIELPMGNLPADNEQIRVHNFVAIECRNFFRPGNSMEWLQAPTQKYTQVFEDRNGFIPGLSILDLLFCEGPAARKWLDQI
jgi:hypothetical protein